MFINYTCLLGNVIFILEKNNARLLQIQQAECMRRITATEKTPITLHYSQICQIRNINNYTER